jgi:hypothetical protein
MRPASDLSRFRFIFLIPECEPDARVVSPVA